MKENGVWHWGNTSLMWIHWDSVNGQPENDVHHTHIGLKKPYSGKYLFTNPGGNIYTPMCEPTDTNPGI